MSKINVENQIKNINCQFGEFMIVSMQDLLQKKLDHDPTKPHKIHFFALLVVISGKGKHFINHQKYSFEKGTVLSIAKNQVHHFIQSNAEGYLITFLDSFLTKFYDEKEINRVFTLFNELNGSPKIQLERVALQELVLIIDRLIEESKDKDIFSDRIARSFLQIILSKLDRYRKSSEQIQTQNKYFADFLNLQLLVKQKYQDTKKVTDYAKELGFSTKKLNIITKSILNISAKDFIDNIVTIEAKCLLKNTHLSIKEIAYSLGFDEPANFSRYFKKNTNRTPEEYRKYNHT